ncbi:hypothetical protein PZE06_05415 [Robertmurraya sp. DFI.2.37]|uniref:hypothetical protein n=1 Tax=Robertmurraya sp. DFI.2.37 TaxID=3031819 RepID=UPI001247C144|nr:hypothetical protein [Robertmurraya sp. DFI.2.37]MDF1507619.1 hypothetical protein [Robertmurraya sp. DFI.2.37]
MFLEYEVNTRQVVEIHENIPELKQGYDYAITSEFEIGDEFEKTIWINIVDENKNLLSYSAIRNNPNAKRLLEENALLKAQNTELMLAVAELGETSEKSIIETQLAIAELAKIITGEDDING